MTFTTHDNPFIRRPAPPHHPTVYEADGRRFAATRERRRAKAGEFVLGPLGVAQANRNTADEYPILREIEEGASRGHELQELRPGVGRLG